MIHFSLFSGIGGFDLASEWAGWNNYLSCEINDFGNRILKYYWPYAYHHTDIHTLTYDTINDELSRRFGDWRKEPIILTGGFPCQPYSGAGQRKGTEDSRHLWPEMLRVIREVSPDWVVGENVFGLTNWSGGLVFEQVQTDLEACGYEVQPFILPACSVNAPHKRDRVWFVAHSNYAGTRIGMRDDKRKENDEGREGFPFDELGENSVDATDTRNERLQGCENNRSIGKSWENRNEQSTGLLPQNWENFPTQPPVCSRNDELSNRLDGITFSKWRNESIKSYGNAIVPAVAYQIFKAINDYDSR